jgi:phosphopantothenoylcysteine decarboxylase / phosphopantothenate---cysteine ligase
MSLNKDRPKILFKLTGSIACFKAAALISKLVQNDFEVQTVASTSALKFIGEATLEGLTGRKVLTDTFASGDLMGHINWAKWADLTVIYPATANTINKLANGVGEDLISTLFLAHPFTKPYLIAPAMNSKMLLHPATQNSLERLRSYGVQILEPGEGALACGETGSGRLIEPEEALKEIGKHIAVQRLNEKFEATKASPKKILVTLGGTKEIIDGVRSIANASTGQTGNTIAEYLSDVGHSVTAVCAKGVAVPKSADKIETFVTYSDLDSALSRELSASAYDAVIHLAAVSDYSVESVEVNGKQQAPSSDLKIASGSDLKLNLKSNPKIIDRLMAYSVNKKIQIIGFKLTANADSTQAAENIESLIRSSNSNFVVHNDISEISNVSHRALIVDRNGKLVTRVESKKELAEKLEQLIREVTL